MNGSGGLPGPAYRSDPQGRARGSVIVVHEIFGLTPHIKSVCDRLAAAGYTAVAPDLFAGELDGAFLPYTAEGKQRGVAIKNRLGEERLADTLYEWIRHRSGEGRVGVMGFCLGGTLAWIAAGKPEVACAICYYGVGLLRHAGVAQQAPVLMHFGRRDPAIPAEDIARFRERQPGVEVHEYDAGHAFNRDDDAAYVAPSAEQAWRRSMAFLGQHLDLASNP
ncbi:MAG: dienelactone hydrolase family protein [Noviherbaspirillum sp.]